MRSQEEHAGPEPVYYQFWYEKKPSLGAVAESSAFISEFGVVSVSVLSH